MRDLSKETWPDACPPALAHLQEVGPGWHPLAEAYQRHQDDHPVISYDNQVRAYRYWLAHDDAEVEAEIERMES